ncbi:MAG: hypothetical protein P8129_06010 [Anaerolineae bacterium]
MKDLAWRSAVTVAALMVLALLGPGHGRQPAHQAGGQAPEAQVVAYLQAVANGDRQAALDHLHLPGQAGAASASRGRAVTDELLAYGSGLEYHVVGVEWQPAAAPAALANEGAWAALANEGAWAALANEGAWAGIARVRVAAGPPDSAERIYAFDVLASGGRAGDSGGTVRGWAIVDVGRQAEGPLAQSGEE